MLTCLNLLAAIARIKSMEREINEQCDKLLECEAHSSGRWAHLAARLLGCSAHWAWSMMTRMKWAGAAGTEMVRTACLWMQME